jgi:hypothetical protein
MEPMNKLREYQKSFYEAIFTNKPKVLQNTIGDIEEFDERFKIYSNNVFSSLKNAIKDDFPKCQKVLGEEKFNKASFEFVRNFPPISGCLLEYGQRFPGFLEVYFQDIPYIKDVAKLEWAKKELYYKANSIPLDPATLTSLAPEVYESLTFEFPEATFFLKSSFAIREIWEGNELKCELKSAPTFCLMIRPRYQIEFYWLNTEEINFLSALYEMKTLGQAYENAVHINPEFDLSGALKLAITREYFTKAEITHEN